MWKKASLVVALLSAGVMAMPASALTVNQIQNLIGTDPFRWEDNDIERHIDLDGDGRLDVGDQLVAIVEIEKIINEATGEEYVMGGANSSLSGISVIEVVSKTPTATPGVYNFVFAAPGGALGTVVTFYEDPVDNLNITNCGATPAICEGTVTDGTSILELGFNGSFWENWAATGPENPDLRSVLTSTDVGGFNFNITVLASSIDKFSTGDPWNGSGSLQGCTSTTGTLIGSCQSQADGSDKYLLTTDTQLAPFSVPEPGSLGLLGLGLLGLFAARRRA